MDMFKDIIITEVSEAVTIPIDKNHHETIKERPHYGLSFCVEGKLIYNHKGEKIVSAPNCAIILPKSQTYTLKGIKNGVFPLIDFECLGFLCDKITSIPIRNQESFLKDFEQIKSMMIFEKNRAKIISLFYNIIHNISTSNDTIPNILMPALNYIENNYSSSDLTNEVLAQKCNISQVYFRKLFTETYKVPPKQYIIDVRINKAKQLLTEGLLKICAISEKCGFSSVYHFSRLFKQKTGLTPSEYMKKNKIYKI